MVENSLGFGVHVFDILDSPFNCLAVFKVYTRMSSLKLIGNQFLEQSLNICMGLGTGSVDYSESCGFQFTDYIIMNFDLDDLSFIALLPNQFNEIRQYFFWIWKNDIYISMIVEVDTFPV